MNMNLKACNLSIHIIHTAHELGSYDYDSYEFEAVAVFCFFYSAPVVAPFPHSKGQCHKLLSARVGCKSPAAAHAKHTFSAFWLRSSVVSVLISLISGTCYTVTNEINCDV